MSASCVGNQQALYQECLHHDQQTNIQTAVNHWRLVYCNATNATIFISPHLLLFESLSQVKEYVECFTGILCGLDYFISLLGQLPINRVGTERQFSELCSRLTKYGLKSASNLKELDEFLTNNKVSTKFHRSVSYLVFKNLSKYIYLVKRKSSSASIENLLYEGIVLNIFTLPSSGKDIFFQI